MKILKMTASFGALNNATLTPGEEFTLIEAGNEGGKSTWCAFLRAMLYGFPARDRDKAGYLAEKNRYQPWSGAPMEGTLEVLWQGREMTIYRGPKGNTVWGAFSARWSATQEPVPGLTAENCGETLLGVSREVFERTAFVHQGQSALSPSADLEKRVATLCASGQEDVSYSQVERRLKDWLNRRKVNSRVGLIPDLTSELAQVEAAMARQGELLASAQAARQEQEALLARRGQLEELLRAQSAQQQAQQSQRRQSAQSDYEQAAEALAAAQAVAEALPPAEELRRAQGDLSYLNTLTTNLRMAEKAIPPAKDALTAAEDVVKADPYFSGWDAAQAAAKAQSDHDKAVALQKKRPSPLLLLLVPVLGTAGLTAYFALRPQDPFTSFPWWSPLAFALPILWGASLLALVPLVLLKRKRQKKLTALMERYQAQSPEDILTRGADFTRKAAAVQEAQRGVQAAETERDKLSAQKAELIQQLLDFVHPFAPEVSDPFGISAALSRALQQGERFHLARAKVEAAERLLTALPTPEGGAFVSTSAERAELSTLTPQLERAAATAARLQGELTSLGDPAELSARRSQLLEELDKRQREYEAISAAMDGLKAADSQLQERFSPAVNAKTGAYLATLTGGKYDNAALTRQFQAMARESDAAVSRQDLSLSTGTAEQLYLAARLAMCELALSGDEPCPILLDDALASFDDRRAALALDCLRELAQTRQVLLFSCHSREKELLRKSPSGQANVTIVELK